MKRALSSILLIFISINLFSLSIEGGNIENPFPSEENLKNFNFSDIAVYYPEIEINLITTETGDELYSYFGHTSLEINVPSIRPSFFDYGFFSFSEGFYRNFIFGRLLYNVYQTDGTRRIEAFKSEDRTVHRTPLSLGIQEKNAILSFLLYNTRPENNTYLYDYYFDNCATRVRDIYNEATGGAFKTWASGINTGLSLREEANIHLDKSPLISFTLNFLEGPSIDKAANLYEASFLPINLMKAIEQYQDTESTMVYESASRQNTRSHSLMYYTCLFSVAYFFIALLLYGSKIRFFNRLSDIINALIYLYFFILSTLLIFFMAFTNHSVTYFNANVLYANPLMIILLAEAIRGKRTKKRFYISVLELIIIASALIIKGMFPLFFIQENIPHLIFLSALYLINVIHYFISKERS